MKLFGVQQLNGSYEITESGVELAEKINTGDTIIFHDGEKRTISDLYKSLPHVFYFKCDKIKSVTYGIEHIKSVIHN